MKYAEVQEEDPFFPVPASFPIDSRPDFQKLHIATYYTREDIRELESTTGVLTSHLSNIVRGEGGQTAATPKATIFREWNYWQTVVQTTNRLDRKILNKSQNELQIAISPIS